MTEHSGIQVQLDPNKVVMTVLPLFHVASALVSLCCSLTSWLSTWYPPVAWDLHPCAQGRRKRVSSCWELQLRSRVWSSLALLGSHEHPYVWNGVSFPELHGVSLGLGRAQRKTKREKVITNTGRMIVEHAKARAVNWGPHCSVGRFS